VGIEPGWVVTRETRVPVARWPAELGLLRIAIGRVHENGRDLFVTRISLVTVGR
jgi:hypothetical protein